ncbi:SMC-Scp complex subunit ScpB [Candidatus Parcubacteria bacterium]|nr:MAG: SMC-Scp complex subunit ScpB [Candidatus Parcubacteria bacterium]
MSNLKQTIESILFLHGEPIAAARLGKATGAKPADVQAALVELQKEYAERGIVLVQNGDDWQFATNPAQKSAVEQFITADMTEELTRAALDTLTVIAYQGPLTRARIEYIRGVNSSFTLRNLMLRGLVEREENPSDRRSFLYRISHAFLNHIGVSSVNDLPRYAEFHAAQIEVPTEPGIESSPNPSA